MSTFRSTVLAAGLALCSTASLASNCESVRAMIDARIAATGVGAYTLTVVEAAAEAPGKVVGNCDAGARKIVYLKGSAAAPSRKLRSEGILTECKDGTVSVGGDCRK